MALGLIGRKIGMTQVFGESGEVIPATVIEAGPCTVLQVKTVEREGYNAVQLGFGRKRKSTKALAGHCARSQSEPKRVIREFRVDETSSYQAGQQVNVEIFKDVPYVDVSGVGKGKGFAGVMKRWGFHGGPDSHGGMGRRAPGSIGQASSPSRVFKGMKMAGRMGGRRRTISSLRVLRIDTATNQLVVKGATPGPRRSYVTVHPAAKQKKVAVSKHESPSEEKGKGKSG